MEYIGNIGNVGGSGYIDIYVGNPIYTNNIGTIITSINNNT